MVCSPGCGRSVSRTPTGALLRAMFARQNFLAFASVFLAFIVGSAALPSSGEPLITGPRYQDGNIAQAFQIGNRLGRDRFRDRQWTDHAALRRAFPIALAYGHVPSRRAVSLLNCELSHSAAACRMQTRSAATRTTSFTLPILTLAGRGMSVALSLYYNSKLWTNGVPGTIDGTKHLVFDHDADWRASGWSPGFGKVVQVGLHGASS